MTLKSYISGLKALAEEESNKQKAEQDLRPLPTRKVLPLTLQIEELMRSLPPALRDRPWSMVDLVGRLQGQYRARPHAAGVGQSLRALGFIRVRDWSVAGGGRRVWLKMQSS